MTHPETPPCMLCGLTTTSHCLYCDWWECLSCDVRGVGQHVPVPRHVDPKREKT